MHPHSGMEDTQPVEYSHGNQVRTGKRAHREAERAHRTRSRFLIGAGYVITAIAFYAIGRIFNLSTSLVC